MMMMMMVMMLMMMIMMMRYICRLATAIKAPVAFLAGCLFVILCTVRKATMKKIYYFVVCHSTAGLSCGTVASSALCTRHHSRPHT